MLICFKSKIISAYIKVIFLIIIGGILGIKRKLLIFVCNHLKFNKILGH